MNERMREPFHTLIWKASIGYNDSWSQVDPEVLQRFAELIVKKCAGIVADAVDHREPASTYVDKIKQHFGVE